MCASTKAKTVTAKKPFLLKAAPIAEVGASLFSGSKGVACGAVVSKTTLSTAATTLGTAGETFLNSSASFLKLSSDVGKRMLPYAKPKKSKR